MPLFGPNIKKMTLEKDLAALRKLLTSKELRTCLDALKAIADLQDVEGLAQGLASDEITIRVQAAEFLKRVGPQGVSRLVQSLLRDSEFGNTGQKLEAMVVMQGRYPLAGVPGLLMTREQMNAIEFDSKVPMDGVREALQKATRDSNLMVTPHFPDQAERRCCDPTEIAVNAPITRGE